jgi:hypothetical protein
VDLGIGAGTLRPGDVPVDGGVRYELAAQTRALLDQADALHRIGRLAGLWYVLTWIWIVSSVLLFLIWALARVF